MWRKLKLLKWRNQVSQIFSACCSYTFSLLGITLLAEINILWQTFTHSYTQTWCPHAVVLHYLVTSFLFFFYTCTLQFRIAECCPLVRLSHFCCTRPAAFTMHQFMLKETSLGWADYLFHQGPYTSWAESCFTLYESSVSRLESLCTAIFSLHQIHVSFAYRKKLLPCNCLFFLCYRSNKYKMLNLEQNSVGEKCSSQRTLYSFNKYFLLK